MKMILPQDIRSFVKFLDEHRCRLWMLEQLHPDGIHCPHCGQALDGERISRRFYTLKKVACSECRRKFNAFTGTLFAHTRMSCRQIIVMFLLLRIGKRNCEVAKWAKVSPATALRWRDILVAHGAELGQRYVDADDLLSGPGSREHSP